MEKYNDQFKAVVLGALLHDIGKFWQRSDDEVNYENSNLLSAQTKRNIDGICPKRKSYYSHKHSLWTNEFFEKYQSKLNQIFDNYNSLGQNNTANLASYHHNPSTPLQILIQQADWMSSGMERIETKDEKDEEEIQKYRYRKVRLKPIFENVSLTEKINSEFYYHLKSFEMDRECIFPVPKQQLTSKMDEDLYLEYGKIWKNFERDFSKIKYKNFYEYIATLLSVLERHTWCIPSSTSDIPDISLYDHLKTTAAIASSCFTFHDFNHTIEVKNIKDREEVKFILLGGDLSGIQKYIFDLKHTNIKKLTKILRARSFYLTMLPKVIVTKILFDNGLTSTNIIVESGGRFILLLPNIPTVIEYLKSFNTMLKNWCLQEFYGELLVNLDWSTTLTQGDFFNQNFKEKLQQVNYELEVKKLQKLTDIGNTIWSQQKLILGDDYESLLKEEAELCETCGKRPANPLLSLKEEQIKAICDSCYNQSKIGGELTKHSLISISKKPTSKIYIKFFGEKSNQIYVSLNKPQDIDEILKNPDLISLEQIEKSLSDKFVVKRSFIANHVPRFSHPEVELYRSYIQQSNIRKEEMDEELKRIFPGAQKTFTDISIPPESILRIERAEEKPDKEKEKGAHLLAILKADVDNLGLIFGIGLQEKVSISRYSTLSRMINAFFCGYLDHLIAEKFPNIYTVYAGGDDVFLIGFWKDIIDFAPVLNEHFRNYSCLNPNIHLSAGIELIKPRTPINKGAEKAEEKLNLAKSTENNKKTDIDKQKEKEEDKEKINKNKLCVFHTPIYWENLPPLMEWAAFLDKTYNDDQSKIKSAFLYRLLTYQKMALDYINEKKVEGLLYLSHLSYDLKRNIERKDKNGKIINMDELNMFQKLTLPPDLKMKEHLIKYIHIPIFYTLYKNRGASYE